MSKKETVVVRWKSEGRFHLMRFSYSSYDEMNAALDAVEVNTASADAVYVLCFRCFSPKTQKIENWGWLSCAMATPRGRWVENDGITPTSPVISVINAMSDYTDSVCLSLTDDEISDAIISALNN